MIKWLVQFILISIIAFFSGLYGFSYFGDKIYEDEDMLLVGLGGTRSTELLLSSTMRNIELMQNGEIEAQYKFNCQTLEMFIPHLEPETYIKHPDKYEEVAKFKEKAIEMLSNLKEQGQCYE